MNPTNENRKQKDHYMVIKEESNGFRTKFQCPIDRRIQDLKLSLNVCKDSKTVKYPEAKSFCRNIRRQNKTSFLLTFIHFFSAASAVNAGDQFLLYNLP